MSSHELKLFIINHPGKSAKWISLETGECYYRVHSTMLRLMKDGKPNGVKK